MQLPEPEPEPEPLPEVAVTNIDLCGLNEVRIDFTQTGIDERYGLALKTGYGEVIALTARDIENGYIQIPVPETTTTITITPTITV